MESSQKTSELDLVSYLRGLASFGVVLYHVRHDMWVGMNDALHGSQSNIVDKFAALFSVPCAFLGSGVLLFFVISGFCIHFPHAGAKGRSLELGKYSMRRAWRIYPPYVIAILVAFLVEWLGVHLGYLKGLSTGNSVGALFLLQDATGGQPVCDGPLWTIPVEVGFYILFPLIYKSIKDRSNRLLPITLFLAAVSITLDAYGIRNTLTKVFGYWFIWVIGAQLAESFAGGRLRSPSWKFILLAAFGFAGGVFFTAADLVNLGHLKWSNSTMVANCSYGVGFATALWWLLTRERGLPVLSRAIARPLLFLGDISYSLYLVHTPFFIAAGWFWVRWMGDKPRNFFLSLAFSLGAVVVAYCFYRLVELPSHRLARALAKRNN